MFIDSTKTLLRIGKRDVFDAKMLVDHIRANKPQFDIVLERDITKMAAWFATGEAAFRARFVDPGCEQRFLDPPFAGFNSAAYKSDKVFQ